MGSFRMKSIAGFLLLLYISYSLVASSLAFLRVFSSPHSGIAWSQSVIKNTYLNLTADSEEKLVIPRKIHQIYHDWSGWGGNVPHAAQWARLKDSCINRNPEWEYKLWSTAESREFLQREYPWFLSTYDSYRYSVQRVDALKYFILRHYGGIYIDMDNGCLESLEPLRLFPAFVTDGTEGPLFINILGSIPHHPFYEYLTNNMRSLNLFQLPIPYFTIHSKSGRWFFTSMWEKYHSSVNQGNWNFFPSLRSGRSLGNSFGSDKDAQLYRVIMDSHWGAERWVFWNEGAGLTWEDWDYSIFSWIGENAQKLIRIITIVAVCLSMLIGLVLWRCCYRGRKTRCNVFGVFKPLIARFDPRISSLLGPLRQHSRQNSIPKRGHDIV